MKWQQMGTSHSRLWTITIPLSLTLFAFAHYRWRQRKQRKIEHYEQVGHVTGLFIYPVKSCAGISLETADCLTEGLQFDRSVYLCFHLLVCSNVMDVHYYAKVCHGYVLSSVQEPFYCVVTFAERSRLMCTNGVRSSSVLFIHISHIVIDCCSISSINTLGRHPRHREPSHQFRIWI